MSEIVIRRYEKEDEAAVEEITFRTGFQGEDLTGRGYFDDKRLFFLIFIYYYARYEPEHFFVAVDTTDSTVVGFICGTPDTVSQRAHFLRTMTPRIALRAFLVTVWRYPRTFKTLLGFIRTARDLNIGSTSVPIDDEYPAHLHIDLLPEYQSQGIGTRLMARFETHMRGQHVAGIHLGTTNRNHKAVPFYRKMGFEVVKEVRARSHPAGDGLILLTFAKKLSA
jgi:ribosomal protein S18 acetylase RimI-like enzyme